MSVMWSAAAISIFMLLMVPCQFKLVQKGDMDDAYDAPHK